MYIYPYHILGVSTPIYLSIYIIHVSGLSRYVGDTTPDFIRYISTLFCLISIRHLPEGWANCFLNATASTNTSLNLSGYCHPNVIYILIILKCYYYYYSVYYYYYLLECMHLKVTSKRCLCCPLHFCEQWHL